MSFVDRVGLRELQKPKNIELALRNIKYAERTQYFLAVIFLFNGELLTAILIGIMGLVIRASKRSRVPGTLTIIIGSLVLMVGMILVSIGALIGGIVLVCNGIMSVRASAFLNTQEKMDIVEHEMVAKKTGFKFKNQPLIWKILIILGTSILALWMCMMLIVMLIVVKTAITMPSVHQIERTAQ